MVDHQSAQTKETARTYFDSWTNRQTAATRALLDDGFRFAAGDMRIEGAEQFLDAGAFPAAANIVMVSEAYEGGDAFQMYDASIGDLTVRIVEHLVIADGLIQSSEFVTDMAAFMALVSA